MDKQHLPPSIITSVLIAVLMVIVQVVPAKPLLLSERLMAYGGWIQVLYCFPGQPGAANFVISELSMHGMQEGKQTEIHSVTIRSCDIAAFF